MRHAQKSRAVGRLSVTHTRDEDIRLAPERPEDFAWRIEVKNGPITVSAGEFDRPNTVVCLSGFEELGGAGITDIIDCHQLSFGSLERLANALQRLVKEVRRQHPELP